MPADTTSVAKSSAVIFSLARPAFQGFSNWSFLVIGLAADFISSRSAGLPFHRRSGLTSLCSVAARCGPAKDIIATKSINGNHGMILCTCRLRADWISREGRSNAPDVEAGLQSFERESKVAIFQPCDEDE